MNTKPFRKKNQRTFLAVFAIVILLSATNALAAAGSLDPTFGSNGVVTTKYNGLPSSANEVALQTDGKIVVLGTVKINDSQSSKTITRYNSNGTMDTSFGANGSTLIDVNSFSGSKIALLPDGRVIVGGKSGEEFAAVRYNGNGTLDTSFGTNGLGVIDWGYSEIRQNLAEIVIQSDGKIFVVGDYTAGQSNYTDIVFARFNSNGTKDITNTIDFPNSRYNYGQAVVVQSDGKIVISGNMQDNDGKNQLSLARLNQDGSLDKSTFGTNGTVETQLSDFQSSRGALALQSDGKIIVAGTTSIGVNQNLTVVRYNSNGTLDATFGGTGIVTTDFGNNEQADDLVIQSDGKIIVEGKTTNLGSSDFLLVRYNSDGSLDTTFGANGKVITDFGNDTETGMSIVMQPDGKVVVVGTSGENAILARYDTGSSNTTTTLTFNSVPAYDGWILESGENTNKGGTLDKKSNLIYVGDDAKNRQYRGILSFNTDSIPDNATVTAGQVKIKRQSYVGTIPLKTHGAFQLEIRNGSFNNDVALTLEDFSAPASTGSTQDVFSGLNTNAIHTATLSNANLSLVNKVGVTQFRISFSKDDNDDMDADYLKLFSGETTSAADQPQLIITFSTASTPTNQPPAITSNGGGTTANISLPENTTAVTTVTATDPDAQTLTYSISGGADAALFNINPSAGTLSFVTAPSYNVPNDAGLDHIYNVTVQASDGQLTDSQELVISITLPSPPPPGVMQDATFGSNGVATTKINGLPTSTHDVVLQPDGKIITLGSVQAKKVITRYNNNGALDTSFGTNGSTFIEVTPFSGSKIALQTDGKLIVAGLSHGGFAVVRYNSNGSLDTSFGTNGMGALNLETNTDDLFSLEDVTIQPDGKIVVVGSYQFRPGNHIDFQIARFNSDGTRDVINTIDWGDFPSSRYNWGKAVAIQPDNKIIMSGNMLKDDDGKNYISLTRLNPDLVPDKSTFGTNGKGTVTARLDNFQNSSGALALQPDGKIVIAGTIFNGNMDVPQNLTLARFNIDGSLDATFGGTGIVVTDFGAQESAADLVIQASGKIILAGTTSSAGASDFLLVRYNSDGSLDSSFGTNGKLTSDFGNSVESVTGIVQQSDGKVIVSGNSGDNAILVRYLTGTTGATGTTTSTSFKSAGSYDGWILESGEFSNAGGSLDKLSNVINVGDDAKNRQYRGILSFDTNSIPDNATITAAQVKIKKQGGVGADPFSTLGDLLLDIRKGPFSNDITLNLGDFSAFADSGSTPEKFAAADSGWYSASLSNINLGLINKYGATQFRLLFSKDDNNNMSADYIKFFSGDSATGQPELFITYSTPGGTSNQAPVIYGGSSISISIPENTTTVGAVTAADPNGQSITYSISGVDANKFSINPTTGILTFLTAPNFEAIPMGTVYHVTGQASDGSLTSTQDIAVTVTPVNEFAPVATSSAGTNISLPENTIDVTTITATDADLPTPTINYILGGVDGQLFNFDSSTGKLSFVTAPSYNAPNDAGLDHVYNVNFEINDGELITHLELVISIIKTNSATGGVTALRQSDSQSNNNNDPVITSKNAISVPENSAIVTKVTAIEADLPAQTLTYSITGGSDSALFNIDSSTGDLRFITAPDFELPKDAGADNIYNVTVQASDGERVVAQDIVVTVTSVNDNDPVVTSNNAISVPENTATVTKVTATDADLPAQTLTYSITGGSDSALFNINSSTGELNFIASPDFELPKDAGTDNIYNVTVQSSDGERVGSQDIVVTVTPVNEHNPIITSNGTISIAENSTTVTTVTATDADLPVQPLTYSITGGSDSALFNINSSTGELTFIPAPDFEAPKDAGSNNIYNVTVKASDGERSSSQDVTVTVTAVNDNNPVITSNAAVSIAENTGAVTKVTATDADLPTQSLTYSITGGSDSALFSINSSSGELNFVAAPDFETPKDVGVDNIYNVTVQVSDGERVGSQDVVITVTSVNDNNPVITSNSAVSIAEISTTAATVTATDADLPTQPLTYSIVGGSDSALFTINSSTGELTFITAPDYEIPTDTGKNNIYNTTVQASDGTLNITQDVVVTVTAVNDNTPVITSAENFSVPENILAVATVTAKDPDLPAQTLTYSITGGADLTLFTINSSTGELAFVTAQDYEIPKDTGSDNVYNVTVQASDGTLNITQNIAITIIPVNDNSPVVTSLNIFSIPENTTAIATLAATDADHPAEPLTYSITGGVDKAKFSIVSATGALTFTAAPDFEAPTDSNSDNVYEIEVQVSDGTHNSSQKISVHITDVDGK